MEYFFYYYIQFGWVACAKVAMEKGEPVGGPIKVIGDNLFKITEQEYYNLSLFDLKGKYEYKDTDKKGESNV